MYAECGACLFTVIFALEYEVVHSLHKCDFEHGNGSYEGTSHWMEVTREFEEVI